PAANAWLKNSTSLFNGTASDGAGSGIATVYLVETARAAGAPAKGDPARQAAIIGGANTWTATVDIGASGERDLHSYSVDLAGNESEIATHAFGLDTAAPVVSAAGGSSTQNVSADFTIQGSFSDTSGLASVAVQTSTDNDSFSDASPATASFDAG